MPPAQILFDTTGQIGEFAVAEQRPSTVADPLDQGAVKVIRVLGHHTAQTCQHLMHGLMKFSLARVAADNLSKYGLQFLVDVLHVVLRVAGLMPNF